MDDDDDSGYCSHVSHDELNVLLCYSDNWFLLFNKEFINDKHTRTVWIVLKCLQKLICRGQK